MSARAEFRCRCGEVRGFVADASPRTVNRVVCYCDDCQAFAHRLGRADLLDAHGGSDVVQVAPASLGSLHYDLNTEFAATVVWNFIPSWHLKVNYAQGFRPPVFNNTTSNGEAVQIGGNPDLTVEVVIARVDGTNSPPLVGCATVQLTHDDQKNTISGQVNVTCAASGWTVQGFSSFTGVPL